MKTRRRNYKKKSRKTYKKTKRSINLVKLNCSPKPKNEINDFSCYSNKSLFKLRDLWNARHPDVKIKSSSPKEIHDKISKYLASVCNKESCWLKQKSEFGNVDSETTESFAPERPKEWKKNPNEWLSSVDIMSVMKQYEKAYKCFDFIGPSPIDFDTKQLYGECVWDELCNFSIKEQIKKGKTKIGIIFNTDPHDGPGEHWISMFINIRKKKIFFFDSAGDGPPKEVMVLVNRIIDEGKNINPKMNFIFDSNKGIEHQYGNTECGIYSIFFIVHLLEDKFTEHYLKTHILKDKYMENFRHVYFNESL
jgi:hypothetical protein